MNASWRRSFLFYLDFHSLLGYFAGHVKVGLSRGKSNSQVVSTGHISRACSSRKSEEGLNVILKTDCEAKKSSMKSSEKIGYAVFVASSREKWCLEVYRFLFVLGSGQQGRNIGRYECRFMTG